MSRPDNLPADPSTAVPAAAAVQTPATNPAEHPAQGGSYTRDPDTGALTLNHRTAPPEPSVAPHAADPA